MCDDDYFVEVGGYSGPRQFTDPGREKWVSIPKMNYRTDCNRHSRQGYPIRLAYALTIHKSQGQTTNKVVVDLGKNEKSLGMAYVALSRVKHYSGLAVLPFPTGIIKNILGRYLLQYIAINILQYILQLWNHIAIYWNILQYFQLSFFSSFHG